ncbi:MAG: transposase [Oscillospiraceae bacterium]
MQVKKDSILYARMDYKVGEKDLTDQDFQDHLIRYSQDKKKQAVFDLCERSTSAENIAKKHGVPRSTIYKWKKGLLDTEKIKLMQKKSEMKCKKEPVYSTVLPNEKAELESQIESLKKEVFRLQMEHDILEKASELLKKDVT